MNVRQILFDNQDLNYKEFHSRLVPNIDSNLIIGVRVPILRKLAKEIVKEHSDFDIKYYEEKMLKGFCIGYSKSDTADKLNQLKSFIPLIDNWAVCDCVCSTLKFAEKNRKEVWNFLCSYINADDEYCVRFAIVMMMDYFLTDEYIDDVIDYFVSIKSDYYYINMAVAWALSAAYIKYNDIILPLLKKKELSQWVHNKTIQKICESNRVDISEKAYLKTLKIK
ncbi:MAG: DNA alkylation repair protein [Acetobacter sp.]|nr:DNA alkylation repair protein [Bacteroides sp.]MCM1341431.1 DNA alkylation repair protein [Acetobacter sp.]MCM1433385.1 DNA alkylation repair protein [Clostridiales bacterium]